MKTQIVVCLIFLVASITRAATPAEEKAFTDKYKAAFESKNTAALESFLYTQGADPTVVSFYKMMQSSTAGGKVAKIELADLTPDEAKKAAEPQDSPSGGKLCRSRATTRARSSPASQPSQARPRSTACASASTTTGASLRSARRRGHGARQAACAARRPRLARARPRLDVGGRRGPDRGARANRRPLPARARQGLPGARDAQGLPGRRRRRRLRARAPCCDSLGRRVARRRAGQPRRAGARRGRAIVRRGAAHGRRNGT